MAIRFSSHSFMYEVAHVLCRPDRVQLYVLMDGTAANSIEESVITTFLLGAFIVFLVARLRQGNTGDPGDAEPMLPKHSEPGGCCFW